ncbi:MAG TPA: hypothetical protein VF954_05725, partial [Acidimicrobiales bacterium]
MDRDALDRDVMDADLLLDPPSALPDPVRRLARRAGTDRGLRRLWAGVAMLFLLGLASCMRAGANHPADPYLSNERVPSGVGSFAKVGFRIVHVVDGAEARGPEHCAL